MPKKYRVHKHHVIDAEVYEQWEKRKFSEGEENLSKCVEDLMRRENDNYEWKSCVTVSTATAPLLTPSEEFKQTINNRIDSLVNKDNQQITLEDKGILDAVLVSAKKLVGAVETKFKHLKMVRFIKVSKTDPLEIERLAGLKETLQLRERNERLELMSELPVPVAQDKAPTDTLGEAQLWALQKGLEQRQRKLRMPDKVVITTTTTTNNEAIETERRREEE